MTVDIYSLEARAVAASYALPETENGYAFAVEDGVRVRVHYSRKSDKFAIYRNHILVETYRREIDAHTDCINYDGWLSDPACCEAA